MKTVYHQVLCQQDYLQNVCLFLTMPDVIAAFGRLSQFHQTFLINNQRSHMYQQLLSYDFGDICQSYNIKHEQSDDSNICLFYSQFYCNWDYLRTIARSNDFDTYNGNKQLLGVYCHPYQFFSDSEGEYDSCGNEYMTQDGYDNDTLLRIIHFDFLMSLGTAGCIKHWLPKVKLHITFILHAEMCDSVWCVTHR